MSQYRPTAKVRFTRFSKPIGLNTVPDITVSDNGDLYASWEFVRGQNLGLSFLSNGKISFALFIEDDEPGELSPFWGNAKAHTIYHKIIKSNNLPCVKA